MNKTIKIIIAVVMMLATLLALTACGGNKIVATRETNEGLGFSAKEKLEITFKGDEVKKAVETMEFKNKDEAEAFAALIKVANEDGIKVKKSGKKVTITFTKEAFKDSFSGASKDEIKASLEQQGYKVK